MMKKKRRSNTGFSLVEVVLSTAMMAVILLVAVSFTTSARHTARVADDRGFAVQKGISMIEEVRSFTQQVGDFGELDALDDGVNHNPVLTIQQGALPGDPVSENVTSATSQSGWHYNRLLRVKAFIKDGWGVPLNVRDLRIVSALIYRDEAQGDPTLLADVGTVLRSPGDQAFPCSQSYDVYFMAMENIPGWWVYMSYIKTLMEITVGELQSRNPGLVFRAHWITTSSYGRDPLYAPYVNKTVDSYQDIDGVYFYPGTMPAGESANEYYVPHNMRARINLDGVLTNVYDADSNQWPYTFADEYNHSMRYIDELALFKARCATPLNDPVTHLPLDPPQYIDEESTPTWRILLENMCSHPEKYQNAILINLHGELLPMPAIRNYSDPAKDPCVINSLDPLGIQEHNGMRVVTHPEYLATPTSDNLRLRVYAYNDLCDDDLWAQPPGMYSSVREFTVLLKHVDLSANVNGGATSTLNIYRIYGGVDRSRTGPAGLGVWNDGADNDPYGMDQIAPIAEPPVDWQTAGGGPPQGQMNYFVKYVDLDPGDSVPGDTLIRFFYTPLKCNEVSSQGLDNSARLYGLDYIPSPQENACDFSKDLTSTASNDPKNTARWIIEIPSAMLVDATVATELADPADQITEVKNRLIIETRFGNDLTTGVMYPLADRNKPLNLSRTYAWWTDDRDDVPFTERTQFIGDPRHCPYGDLKDSVPFTTFADAYGTTNPFRNRYNWFWDSIDDSDWEEGYNSGLLFKGWAEYDLRIDMGRYMELLRNALINTDSIYTTLTGYSYFYIGIGNEIGYDSANGFSKGIPCSRKPFYGTSGNRTEQVMVPWANPSDYSTIGNTTKFIKRGYGLGSNYWWGKHWMGELFPDSDFDNGDGTGYAFDGNLPTGSTSAEYVRYRRDWIGEDLPSGTSFSQEKRCLKEEGCNSFFMVGTRSSTFYHAYQGGAYGTLTAAGQEIADDYAFPLPTDAGISRPFRHNWGGSSGWKANPDFDQTTYYPHGTAQVEQVFYDHTWSAPNGMGSALLSITNQAKTHSSFQVMNGLDKTLESGSSFIAKWSLISLVHGFLTAGESTIQAVNRIEQLPRLEIKQPTLITDLADPDIVTVQWNTLFLRWDREKYTQYYPDGFTEPTWIDNLRYVLLYSPDNGDHWYYMEPAAGATPVEAELGKRPTGALAGYMLQDLVPAGDELFDWATPDSLFPEGSYLIRVEVYRETKELHYAYHMEKIFIDR